MPADVKDPESDSVTGHPTDSPRLDAPVADPNDAAMATAPLEGGARNPGRPAPAVRGPARRDGAGGDPAVLEAHAADYPAALERLGDEIAELAAHLQAATARLLDLIREFDARGGWQGGFRSCAHWLGWRVGLDLGAAREHVRVARALGTLPRLAAALASGELSYSKVRAVTRVATPESEAVLLAAAQAGTAGHVERLVRAWRQVDRRAEAEEAARRHRQRWLQVSHDDDGMVVIRGRLEPEAGALVLRALEAADDMLYQRARAENRTDGLTSGEAPPPAGEVPHADEPTYGQRQADALLLLAESALHHDLDPGPAEDRYQVVVHIDAPVLADPAEPGQSVLEDGAYVPAETSRRLACDASRVVMHHAADGSVLDVGRRTRTISPALRRALDARDRGCRFPGCGIRFCQGHHLQHWANGGATRLDNLALLCSRHHRAVHEEGYQVEAGRDGALCFLRPDGRPIPDVPPPTLAPIDPVGTLVTQHRAAGLGIHPRTGCPTWLGEPLDLAWAIDVLHPLARGLP